MRRHGNLFKKIVSRENLQLAYHRARKGKSWQKTIKEFDRNAEEGLSAIREALIRGTYATSPYRIKRIYEPKTRDIYILPFAPDRIVQHALMNVLEHIWESLFIGDSYACRPGRGIHAGSRRTMEWVRSYKYCLKCDIRKFYPSIDHDILYGIIKRKIKCAGTLRLLREVIYSIPGGKNTPIGNYTSQWFGNLYLNELDQEIKHRHRVKPYIRYCDDFLVFDDDKARLHYIKKQVEGFLTENLRLSLSKAEVFPVSRGVDFLGYRHFPKYILLRKSTAKRVKRRMARMPGMLASGGITPVQLRSSIASTEGWMKWANTRNFSISLQLGRLKELYDATTAAQVQ